MGELKLTEAQQRVVDAKDCSLLVAAAAGSGKTAVLVKRIIERLKSRQTSLDRLLIVTFTNAAAAEMKERIGKALRKELEKDPDNAVFKEQSALLADARISTIDSFCNSVVRENFQALDIDPCFSVMEPAENELICSDVLEELFEEEYEKRSEDFMALVSCYGEYKDDSAVRDLVSDLAKFADNEPRPAEWLDECLKDLEQGFDKDMQDEILLEFRRTLKDSIAFCDHYSAEINASGDSLEVAETYEKDAEKLENILEKVTDLDSAVIELNSLDYARLKPKKGLSEEEKEERKKLTAPREEYKDNIKTLRARYFNLTLEEAETFYKRTGPVLTALVRLTREFMERVERVKREKNSFYFSDIAHMAFRILCQKDEAGNEGPTAVAKELADSFDEIMIDEYQDSSYLQEYMLKSISGEYGDRIPNLFMVGDVKQSIYSFRQARPELFEEKYEHFSDTGVHRKIDLSENFRSRKSVLEAVNVLLAPVMKKDMTEIEYDGAAALHFGSKDYIEDDPEKPCYDTELILIDKKLSDVEEEEGEEASEEEEFETTLEEDTEDGGSTTSVEREALTVAHKIREMIDSGFMVSDGVTDAGEKKIRKVRPGDFAILTRKSKGVTEVFAKALQKVQIAYTAETGTGFFDAVEVRKALAFLRILDNPYDDISFAAALYSPYGGFTASDLAKIRIRYGKTEKPGKRKTLYECLQKALEEEEGDELTGKIQRFMECLMKMRALNETLTVHELIEAFYKETGYKDDVTVMPGGDRRRGNLEMLVALAEKYEKSSFAGLHDFIRYIDRLLEKKSDFGEAEAEIEEDAVAILTMHKSKGLEFPVVFACCLGGEFNKKDSKAAVLFNRKYGLGSNLVDRKKRLRAKTMKQIFLQDKEKIKGISEELRVLYVALTRAKEKLFMVASLTSPEKAILGWHNSLLINESPTYASLKKYKTAMDFVGPTIFGEMSEEEIGDLLVGNARDLAVTRHAGKEEYTAHFCLRLHTYTEKTASDLLKIETKEKSDDGPCLEGKSLLDTPGVREEILEQEKFVYPEAAKVKAPMRVSVSLLKHIEIENLMSREEKDESESQPMPGIPDENDKKEVSAGALRGTLYHEVLEKLRYDGDYSSLKKAEESVKKDVESLISECYLEADILKTVSVKDLATFCMSDIGKRMIEACGKGKLHREQPFVYGLSPEEYREYSKTEDETDMVMVQGIIDAYIDEGDEITLVDYKTDKVYKDAEEELTAKYHVQLDLYAKALEKLTGKKVREKVIYSVSAGKDFALRDQKWKKN
ncbi:MAG: helicase-exonuclease AddAB subunit AddA [Lachnospiraceae bacterium]|nr:helicase-exonuclease AddAB subunit AddA [Lachnospiraceae bacterium]